MVKPKDIHKGAREQMGDDKARGWKQLLLNTVLSSESPQITHHPKYMRQFMPHSVYIEL